MEEDTLEEPTEEELPEKPPLDRTATDEELEAEPEPPEGEPVPEEEILPPSRRRWTTRSTTPRTTSLPEEWLAVFVIGAWFTIGLLIGYLIWG